MDSPNAKEIAGKNIRRLREKKNLTQDKSCAYAIRIISLYKYLIEQKKEYVLSKQVLRNRPSFGANL